MKNKIVRPLYSIILFVAVSFVRYFPTKWLGGHPDVSQAMGHDAHLYFQGLAGVNNTGGVGFGHSLTLITSETLKILAPGSVRGLALLGFFSLIYVWSVYFFIKPEIERKWLIFFLVPFALVIHRVTTNGNYAQTLSVSLFMLSFVFWRKDREFLSGLSLVAMFSAHVWSGSLLILVFGAYLLFNSDVNWNFFSQKWSFFLPFVPVIVFLVWRQDLFLRWIDFFLHFQGKGPSLIQNFIQNPTTMENIGILGLTGIGATFLYYNRDDISDTWKFTVIWALSISVLLGVFWGAQTFRIWTMMPFVLPAIYGLDKLLEKGYKLPSVIFLIVCIISGYLGI